MLAPACAPRLPALFSISVAITLLSASGLSAAEASAGIKQAILTGLPRYDPAIREKHLVEGAARNEAKAAAPDPVAGAKLVQPTAADFTPDKDVLVLPKVTVTTPAPRLKALPRPHRSKAAASLPTDPFLVPGGGNKDATAFMRVITFLFADPGAGVDAKRNAALNHFADLIELPGQDPEVTRKLRAEYLRLYNRLDGR